MIPLPRGAQAFLMPYETGAHGMLAEYEAGKWEEWDARRKLGVGCEGTVLSETRTHVSFAKALMRHDAICRIHSRGRSHLTTNARGAPAENCGHV